jgi:hypothetical protein
MRSSAVEFHSRAVTIAAVGLLVIVAVALRGYRLGSSTLWVDEAESALNALTIVADGVPGDHVLGQPIYENTLVRPWPDNPEYEFRDISYSDRGLAVYHSWLPLYSIAAAFRLAGVTPADARHSTPLRNASRAEIEYWSAVPRLPAIVFSVVAVVAAWGLGWLIQGKPAAFAFAFTVATSDFFVDAGRQARYYSASIAGGVVCGLAIWNAWRRGRLSDHALAGLAVGVLFHIHSVSAVAMSTLYVAASPMGRHQSRLWLRMLTAGAVGAVLIVPWAAWSGLLSHTNWTPAARGYLDLRMVLSSLPSNPAIWLTLAAGFGWWAAAVRPGSPISDRWRRPILESATGLYFTAGWLAVSYASFLALMPAASFFPYRLNLMIAVPLMLAVSLLVATVGHAVRPGAVFVPTIAMAVILVLWKELPPGLPRPIEERTPAFLGMVRGWELGPGGRIFASPNDHLVLTYYTGRPVQSIFPVRREWLDRFAHDLIILESRSYDPLTPALVHEAARRQGRVLNEAEAISRAREAPAIAAHVDLRASGVSVAPPTRTPDALDEDLVDMVRHSTREALQRSLRGTPLGRDGTVSSWHDFRSAFYYWFSDPARRQGMGLNYRTCRAQARATVLPNGVTVLDCRKTREPPLVPAPAGSDER